MVKLSKIKTCVKAFVILSQILSLTSFSCIATAKDLNSDLVLNQQQDFGFFQSVKQEEKKSSVKAYYKLVPQKQHTAAAVYINGKEVARYVYSAGGFSPEARAKILTDRLNLFLSQNSNPKIIVPALEKGNAIGTAGKFILFTADKKNAEAFGLSTNELAIKWVNNIRTALNTPKITRSSTLIASRSGISMGFAERSISQEFGVASWYGGRFHGKRTADGSRFNTHSFTAAHKTLPFGSIVRVTNIRNGKICLVKITDRGPFVHGRIIDLSRAAAKEVGILSSGVSRVKVEVLR